MSAEGLALAAVGRHGGDPVVVVEHVVLGEALGEFAGLGVPEPYPVARCQPLGGGTADRRLDLAGPFDADEAEPFWQVGPRQPVRRAGAGGDVPAREQGGDVRAWP